MYLALDEAPMLWTQQQGRASVQLMASMAAKAQPDEPSEESEIELDPRELIEPPAKVKPVMDLDRKAERDVLPRHPDALAQAPLDPPLPPEMRPREHDEQLDLELPEPVPRKQREQVDEIAEIDATASPFSVAIEGSDVDEEPRATPTNPMPPYPSEALSAGIQGVVVLWVTIEADGGAGSVRVHQSSGTASLDRAALETVQRWRFIPGRRRGIAVACERLVPVNFTIRR
jgi:protein TonB